MKVFIAELCQETNSFCPVNSTLDYFKSGTYICGNEAAEKTATPISAMGGFLDVVKKYGGEYTCGMCVRAPSSGGLIEHEVLSVFLEDTLRRVTELKPDVVLLGMHGASQGVKVADICGTVCKEVRAAVGPDCIIAVSNDMHANVTDAEMDEIDFICGYQTYPHRDFYQTSARAAELAMRRFNGEELHVATINLPMLVPASGYNTNEGSFKQLMDRAKSLVNDGTLEDFTIFQMQPWLDVEQAGSRVVVVAKSAETAKAYAESFAKEQFANRKDYWPKLYTIEEVIKIAENRPDPMEPVVLVDASDSAGAGSRGDSAAVVKKLLETGTTIRAASTVCDPDSVRKAIEVGVGNTAEFTFGGKYTDFVGGSVTVTATVQSIHNGVFETEGLTGRGRQRTMGICAVLRFGRIDVIVSTMASGSGDTQLYRHFGIEPTFYDLVVVKANTSFRASYTPITTQIYVADTPGPATANLLSLPYKRVPKDFYPFAERDDYVVPEAALL